MNNILMTLKITIQLQLKSLETKSLMKILGFQNLKKASFQF